MMKKDTNTLLIVLINKMANTFQKKQLNRTEIIFALAQHCHQDWYQSILNWPTEYLKALLDWYNEPKDKKNGFKINRKVVMVLVVEL